jgi:LacI family transcriptional regulator
VTAIDDPVIAEAITFIRSQACSGIAVKDVARAVRRSRKTLYRRFEEVVGRSPHAEILRVQLNHARTLLVESPHNLDEIALLSGFTTASYFNVAFKRELGVTPGAYRAQHGKG